MADHHGSALVCIWHYFPVGVADQGSNHLGHGEFPSFLGVLYGTAFVQDCVDGRVDRRAVFGHGNLVELGVVLDRQSSAFDFIDL